MVKTVFSLDHRTCYQCWAEGRSAGRALISAAEEWVRVHNYSIIVLETGAANDRARAFYQRLGYQEESVKLIKVL